MNKTEYIVRQIGKTNKKNYENYVVTRIWHGINSLEIKFSTQQYVNTHKGYALTDMYFPQLKTHIEIDEPYHNNQKKLDIKRETDIIEATNHKILRVSITENLEEINQQIDNIIKQLKEKILYQKSNDNFEP